MAQAGRFGRRVVAIPTRRRSSNRWTTLWLMLLAFAASAAVASLVLGSVPVRLPGVPAAAMPTVAASFPICGGSVRSTCVVDGDTFWLEGTKYRIADIDTPEVSDFGCASEKALGDRATVRLAALLNAGPFALEPADRDEDRYGRKLRVVTRDGASLGAQLVSEGLAHRWGGPDREWC
jgi:micrococcal nuclease